MDPGLFTQQWPPQSIQDSAHQHESRPAALVDDWAKDRSAPPSVTQQSPGAASPTGGLDISDFTLPDIGSPPSSSGLATSSGSFFSSFPASTYYLPPYPTMAYGSWPTQNPVPLSNYSSLNGATTSTTTSTTTPARVPSPSIPVQQQQQPPPIPQDQQSNQPQQIQSAPSQTTSGAQQIMIDPSLTLNGSRSVNMQHYPTANYAAQSQTQAQPATSYPYSYYPAMYRSSPYYQTQPSQGTLSPSALLQPSSSLMSTISPQSFYLSPAAIMSGAHTAPVSTPTSSSSSSTTPPAVTPIPVPEPQISPEERARQFQASVRPLLAAHQFTGAGAVNNLVSKIRDFGTSDVDAAVRLEILTKIRDGAGNHYFRAWSENATAVDITRDWLKAAFMADADSPLVETLMPLLHLIDRLPMTVDSLKASKLGKLVVKLVKDPPTPAIKDMASNVERKWRSLVDRAEGPPPKVSDKDSTEDLKTKKRKMNDVPLSNKPNAPPAKKPAVGTASSSKPAMMVKRELNIAGVSAAAAYAYGGGGAVAAKPAVKDAKSDSSFFSAPKPKPKLPSFKKAPPPPPVKQAQALNNSNINVAQPSSIDPFQEALKSMAKARKESPAVSTPPPAATTPIQQSATITTAVNTNGKKKKKVSWPPDDKLEAVRLIDKAIYDDDPVDGVHVSHSLRDLDRGEGAALHAHIFEETVDWVEPLLIDIPIDIEYRPRGEGSEEKTSQETREQTALGALYMSPAHIPDTPSEPVHVITEEDTDMEVQTMTCGNEADAVFWSGGPVASATAAAPVSVADLVGQLAGGMTGVVDPTIAAATNAMSGVISGGGGAAPAFGVGGGLDLSAVGLDNSNPTVSAIQAMPQEQIQQLLQQLATPGLFPQMSSDPQQSAGAATYGAGAGSAGAGDQSGWAGYSAEYGQQQQQHHQSASSYDDSASDRGVWRTAGGGGNRGRVRGRGRGRGGGDFRQHDRPRPCSFFLAGRCKFGDQCDFSHEVVS